MTSRMKSSNADGTISRIDVQLQLLEEKVFLLERKLETVVTAPEGNATPVGADLVELRRRIGALQVNQEQHLALQKEVTHQMVQDLQEMRAEMNAQKDDKAMLQALQQQIIAGQTDEGQLSGLSEDLQEVRHNLQTQLPAFQADIGSLGLQLIQLRLQQDGGEASEFQTQHAQKVQAVEASVRDLKGQLENVLKMVPEHDPSGSSQLAAFDEELDSLRSSLLTQQDLQSKVADSLWVDAANLGERLEGHQGQLTAVQQQVDHLVIKLMREPMLCTLLSAAVWSEDLQVAPSPAAVLRGKSGSCTEVNRSPERTTPAEVGNDLERYPVSAVTMPSPLRSYAPVGNASPGRFSSLVAKEVVGIGNF